MTQCIKYGWHEQTGRVLHISEAENGLSCHCHCFECKEKLEAVQGRKKEWHFRHNSNINCKGGPETALHKLAKQIIAENTQMVLPGVNLTYKEPKLEQRLEHFIPDVTVATEYGNVHIEIRVSHPVDLIKEQFYKDNALPSIEINLNTISFSITPQELSQLLLNTAKFKHFIYWHPAEKHVLDTHKDTGKNRLLAFFVIAITLLAAFQHYIRRGRRF
ncbi:MAG: hypothetical protein DI539_09820 [Flavobacterium psychrophilum]|nr:MAG: hypothetical protein DI539_09820 [Flavobacterium psychrophilum]